MNIRVYLQQSNDERMSVGVLTQRGRNTAFEYDREFLARGLPLAPFRLPLAPGVSVYDGGGNMETFGLFEDSLPDGWGRRLVDVGFRQRYGRLPTVLERLAVVGSRGMGALVYEPELTLDEAADWHDLSALAVDSMAFDAGGVCEALAAVRQAGGSSGGARPKALIGYDPVSGRVCCESPVLPPGYEHWIVKFSTREEGPEAGRREYDYYRRAIAAGAKMMSSVLIETKSGAFFATRRFDRTANGGRRHFATAAGLLHADFRLPGEEYATLFKLTDLLTHDYSAKCELFRRATLNVLMHNRDDHLKNFGYLMDEKGEWTLAPFYDFTRSNGPGGWQTLSVDGEGSNPGVADLRRLAARVRLASQDAEAIIEQCRTASAARSLG